MTMARMKSIWYQKDREDSMALARRRVLKTLATVESMGYIADTAFHPTRTTDVFYPSAEYPLREAIWHARVLLNAYDYYLARCQEGGIPLDQAETAWQVHASPAFEDELIEAEDSMASTMPLVDAQILSHLGLPPHEAEVQDGEDHA
jgi:hypothetical protein